MSSNTEGSQKPLFSASGSLFGNTTFGNNSLSGQFPSSSLFGNTKPVDTGSTNASTSKPSDVLNSSSAATSAATPAQNSAATFGINTGSSAPNATTSFGLGAGPSVSNATTNFGLGNSNPTLLGGSTARINNVAAAAAGDSSTGNGQSSGAAGGASGPVTESSVAQTAKNDGNKINPRTELELFAHEKIEDVLNGWERKLTRHVDEFRRYSRAVIDMDSVLFDYVDKLMEIQKQQEEVQYRQQELSAVVEKIELKQKSILDTLNQMNRRWSDKIAQLTQRANPLESQAVAVNKLISDLETEVLDVTKQLDAVQAKAYPDGLYQLLLLTNSHCKYVTRLNDMADQINRQISTL